VNPDDLLHAAPAIAKGAAAVGAAIPFTSIAKRMLGPAADEVAEMWRDQVRVYRYGRQLKLLEKAERMAEEAGFTPQPVPPKILFPLLEGASFEEDEDLHTMWAALLANAASPDGDKVVRPGFIATLRELSPDEASLLNWIYDSAIKGMPGHDFDFPIASSALLNAFAELGFGKVERKPDGFIASASVDAWRFGTCLNSLEAAQLIRRRYDLGNIEKSETYEIRTNEVRYSLTYRGHQFVTACRAPGRSWTTTV
jgi:hypothetical protein